MNHKIILFAFTLLFFSTDLTAQNQLLKPGFEAAEYLDLIAVSDATNKDSIQTGTSTGSTLKYELLYRSPEVGLKNRWDLWLRNDQVAVISIRGTVGHPASWIENFYAAMVPAKGEISTSSDSVFRYTFSQDPKAMVHVGWTVGLAYMAPFMAEKIHDLMAEKNIRNLIIVGHSQGGALTYLTTSYFYYLSQQGQLPGKLNIKAYCSAAPKPGNMFYAYDFDYITRQGMGFNVVNAADWVPETPPTVQTFSDINPTNPFYDAETLLGKQKWPANWYLKSVYKKMKKTPKKTMLRYQKYFGHKIFTQAHKYLPGLREPEYSSGSNYMRAGSPVVLMPDADYYLKYPENPKKVFVHHSFEAYKYLLEKIYQTGN